MNYKEAFYFVGKCLSLNSGPEKIRIVENQLISGNVDWNKIVWTASNHFVFPSLYLKLREYQLLKFVPADLATYFRHVFRLNLQRNRNILKQVEELCLLLWNINVAPVFLKGVACLLDNLYSNIGERMIGDIDFLVAENDFLPTIRFLNNSGYYSQMNKTGIDLSEIKHYPRLVKEGAIAAVEVHRQPVGKPYEKYLNNSAIMNNLKKIQHFNNCWVPADSQKMIHNLIHGHLNDKARYYGTISLRNGFDFFLLKQRIKPCDPEIPKILIPNYYEYNSVLSAVFGQQELEHSDKAINIYRFRLNLNLRYPVWGMANTSLLYFLIRVKRFCLLFFQSTYSKKVREYLKFRIKNLSWI